MNIFVILTLLLAILPERSWARPEIKVLPQPEVSITKQVTLLDIIEAKNLSENLIGVLENITLNSEKKYSAAELSLLFKEQVQAQIKNQEDHPAVTLPSEVEIQVLSGLSRSHLIRRASLHMQTREPKALVEVSLQSVPLVTTEEYTVDWSQLQPGSFVLSVKESSTYNPKYITGQIKIKKEVPTVVRNISTVERIQEADLRSKWMDVTYSKEVIPPLNSIIGSYVNRSLFPGQPLWMSYIKKEHAAKKGQILKAIVGDETFEISMNVIAEENGFVGDVIRVKSFDNQKIMSAIVTDKETARIQ